MWKLGTDFIIRIPAEAEQMFDHRIALTVILEDVTAKKCRKLTGTTIQGPGSSRALIEKFGLHPTSNEVIPFDGGWVLYSPRFMSEGYDLWTETITFDDHSSSDEAWEIVRIESGIPKLGQDTNPRTLPPELGPVFELTTINYRKGCYAGQEVLMRIHSRGHTNRVWRGLKCNDLVQVGSAVHHTDREDAGEVTSSILSPRFGPIATAHLRTEASTPGDRVTVISGDHKVEAEVVELPFFRDSS
jgi:folate-binding protein YgfZ